MHPSPGLASDSPPSTGPCLYAVGTSGELRELSLALTGRGHNVEDLSFSCVDEALASHPVYGIVMDAEGDDSSAFVQRLAQLTEIRPRLLALIGHFAGTLNPTLFSVLRQFERPIDLPDVISAIDSALRARNESFLPNSSAAPSSQPDQGVSGPSLFPPMPGVFAADSNPVGAVLSFPAGWLPSSSPSDSPSSPPSSQPSPSSGPLRATRSLAGPTSVSPDLEKLLSAAEERLSAEPIASSDVPDPDAELSAILPEDVLDALQEPLEFEDNAAFSGSNARTPAPTTGTAGPATMAGKTGEAHQLLTHAFTHATVATSLRSKTPTQSAVAPPSPSTAQSDQRDEPTGLHQTRESHANLAPQPPPENEPVAEPVAEPVSEAAIGPFTSRERPVLSSLASAQQPSTRPPALKSANPFSAPWVGSQNHPQKPISYPPERTFPPSDPPTSKALGAKDEPLHREPAPPSGYLLVDSYSQDNSENGANEKENRLVLPEVLSPDFDGFFALAACVFSRASVTVCFESEGVLRRAVFRDGDFVACSSSDSSESLLSFLVARGDLPRELGAKLNNKFPAFGRHAAAALIANGHLGQDQLWSVLRAHGEWLLGKMLLVSSGVCAIEDEPPGRLKAEPAVFGGATGAEVIVEVARRIVSEDEAVRRLGGLHARIAEGSRLSLLAECALGDFEASIVRTAFGRSVGELLEEVGQPDFAALLVALTALGVLELIRSIGASVRPLSGPAHDEMDADAVRKRVSARLAIVQEGDYFDVLGVPRTATAYEIKRAYLELRRAFEPGRLLTAATADLLDSVRLIVECVDEAYDVLKEPSRRERYRRALEALPPQL